MTLVLLFPWCPWIHLSTSVYSYASNCSDHLRLAKNTKKKNLQSGNWTSCIYTRLQHKNITALTENYFNSTIPGMSSLTTRSFSFSKRSGFVSSNGYFHVSFTNIVSLLNTKNTHLPFDASLPQFHSHWQNEMAGKMKKLLKTQLEDLMQGTTDSKLKYHGFEKCAKRQYSVLGDRTEVMKMHLHSKT